MTIRFRLGPNAIVSTASGQYQPADDYHDGDTSTLALEEYVSGPRFINANGNALAVIGGIVGVIGAAVIFGNSSKAAEIQSVPSRPTTFASSPQTDPSQLAPVVFGAPYLAPAQPDLKRTWEQRATQRVEFSGGSAIVFKPIPTVSADQPRGMVLARPQLDASQVAPLVFDSGVVYLAPPSWRTFVVPEQQRREQPAAIVFGSPLLPSAVAPPLRPSIVVLEAQRQYQPTPEVFGQVPLPPTPLAPTLTALARQDPTQLSAVVFGSPLLPSAAAPPLRPTLTALAEQDRTQPAARVFGSPLLPSAQSTPLRTIVTGAPQSDPTQITPELLGLSLPAYLTAPPLRGAIVARPPEQRDELAPRLFGQTPPSYDAPPLRPAKVVNAAQSQEQPAARLFVAPNLPSAIAPPLRPAVVAPPQTDPTQTAALVFRQAPPTVPGSPLRPSLVIPEQASGWQPAPRVFGTLPVMPPPLRPAMVVLPQQDMQQPVAHIFKAVPSAAFAPPTGPTWVIAEQRVVQPAAVVFGNPGLPSAQAPALRPTLSASPQQPPQLAPLLVRIAITPAATPLPALIVVLQQPADVPPPSIFALQWSTQAVPLRGAMLGAPQADPTQIQPRLFAQRLTDTPQLRHAWIVGEQQTGWRLSAQLFTQAPAPSLVPTFGYVDPRYIVRHGEPQTPAHAASETIKHHKEVTAEHEESETVAHRKPGSVTNPRS